ncbi:MAG TPA: hypothetical protein VFA86_11280 [Gammaproteobacteria bacterium]|nr:hypothetical protein [Gammaproteobacteria bacterium]
MAGGGGLALGIWLFLSPLILGFHGPVAVHAHAFGVVIAALFGLALARPRMWEEWLNLALGLWLVLAPFALGFTIGFDAANSIAEAPVPTDRDHHQGA